MKDIQKRMDAAGQDAPPSTPLPDQRQPQNPGQKYPVHSETNHDNMNLKVHIFLFYIK